MHSWIKKTCREESAKSHALPIIIVIIIIITLFVVDHKIIHRNYIKYIYIYIIALYKHFTVLINVNFRNIKKTQYAECIFASLHGQF